MRNACLPTIQVSVSPKVIKFWSSGRKVLRPPFVNVAKVLLKLIAGSLQADAGEIGGYRDRQGCTFFWIRGGAQFV